MIDKPKPELPKKNLHEYAKFGGIAIQMISIIGIGTFGGHLLDQFLALNFPIFTLIMIFTSVGISLYWVMRLLIKK